jgi:hypothetical protein
VGGGGDYVLVLAVVLPLWGYLFYYSYMCTLGCQIEVVECSQESKSPSPPNNNNNNKSDPQSRSESSSEEESDQDGDGDRAKAHTTNRPRVTKLVTFMQYILNPTHEPSIKEDRSLHNNNTNGGGDVPLLTPEEQEQIDTCRVTAVQNAEQWLRHNYYFVADRHWVQYGAAEAIVGSLVDTLEGIPVTSSNRIVCMARPIVMAVLLTILVVLLIWKRPYSVRLQQWSSVTVNVLLLAANITVVVNVVVAHSDIEAVASALLLVASLVIGVLSILDSAMWILTFAPSLRRLFGLQPRLLRTLLSHLREKLPKKKADDDSDGVQHHGQILVVADVVDDDLADGLSVVDETSKVPLPAARASPRPPAPPTPRHGGGASVSIPCSPPTKHHHQRPPPPHPPTPRLLVDMSGKWGMRRGLATTGWTEEELRPKANTGDHIP